MNTIILFLPEYNQAIRTYKMLTICYFLCQRNSTLRSLPFAHFALCTKNPMPWQTIDVASSFQIPFSKAEQVSCVGRVVWEKVSTGNELSNFHLLNTGILPCWGPVRFTFQDRMWFLVSFSIQTSQEKCIRDASFSHWFNRCQAAVWSIWSPWGSVLFHIWMQPEIDVVLQRNLVDFPKCLWRNGIHHPV